MEKKIKRSDVLKMLEWSGKTTEHLIRVNQVLRDAASKGFVPKIIVHRGKRTERLLGKGVQVIEVSFTMGKANGRKSVHPKSNGSIIASA